MKTLSLLIVDDDPVIRRLLANRLTKENHQVTMAESGQEAVMILRESDLFDTLVTDLVLPDMDGIAVLEAAKELRPAIEVLVITAHASVDTAVEAMKKGAIDYLTKPINFDELLLRLDHIAVRQSLVKDARDLLQAKEVTESEAAATIQEMEMQISEAAATIQSLEMQVRQAAGKLAAASAILSDGGRGQTERINAALKILEVDQ